MDIKIKDKVVGDIYVNLQFPIESFEGKKHIEIVDLIKGANGQTQQIFEMSVGKFKISSFRRLYREGGKIYLEGALLEAVQ